MKRLSHVMAVLCLAIAVSPCLGETSKKSKKEEWMKNEPKSFGGIVCGDTPYKNFTPDEYKGRESGLVCAQVYEKKGFLFYFNEGGQLFRAKANCKKADIPGFIKKHGKPAADKKGGSDSYEARRLDWKGNNIDLFVSTSIIELLPPSPPMESCVADFRCKNVANSENGCDNRRIADQVVNTDAFVAQLGVVFGMPVPADGDMDAEFAKYLELVQERAVAIGLPKPLSIRVNKQEGTLYSLQLIYKQSDFQAVKTVLFKKIGDTVVNTAHLEFTGEKASVNIPENHKSSQFMLVVAKKFVWPQQ